MGGARRDRTSCDRSADLTNYRFCSLFQALTILLGLAFRGITFEFQYRDAEHRTFLDHGYCYSFAVAILAQGIALRSFIQGSRIDARVLAGNPFDCFTPITLLIRGALLDCYAFSALDGWSVGWAPTTGMIAAPAIMLTVAASSPSTQTVLRVGTQVVLPVIGMYTA